MKFSMAQDATPQQPSWTNVLQAVAGSAGVLVGVSYAVGWLHWRGYLGYFSVPSDTVDLSASQVLWASFPQFAPLIVIMALMPFLILFRAWDRRTSAELAEYQAEFERIHTWVTASKSAEHEQGTQGDASVLEARMAEHEAILASSEALLGKLDQLRKELPSLPKWITSKLTVPKPGARYFIVIMCLAGSASVALSYLVARSDSGDESALPTAISAAMSYLTVLLGAILIYQILEHTRFTALAIAAVVLSVIFLPLFSWADGRLDADARWSAIDREDKFEKVVFFSGDHIFDGSTSENGLFKSPTFLLIAKGGGTYLVSEGLDRGHVVVLDSSEVVRVDYIDD